MKASPTFGPVPPPCSCTTLDLMRSGPSSRTPEAGSVAWAISPRQLLSVSRPDLWVNTVGVLVTGLWLSGLPAVVPGLAVKEMSSSPLDRASC